MNTEDINLQPGDERAYSVMAIVAKSSLTELLIPFNAAESADALLAVMSLEDFFQKFLIFADKFADLCCQRYAKIMRQCALVGEIRGTPTLALAKDIRENVFEPLDTILINYIRTLKKLGFDLSSISAELNGSSITDAALKGAAVGQVAGGFGGSGKTLGALNALIQAGVEAEKKLALLQQRAEVLKQSEAMTLPIIVEYLKAVGELPERLLDYGCARSFGSQVSFERQHEALKGVKVVMEEELAIAIRLVVALPDAQKRIELQRLAKTAESKIAPEPKLSPGQGILWLLFAGFLACWACNGGGLNSGDEIIAGLLGWIGAAYCFLEGIKNFQGKKMNLSTEIPEPNSVKRTDDDKVI